MVTQNLVEMKEGIYLFKDSASKLYKNEINKLLYFMDDNFCYGILKLKHPDKIGYNEFNKLRDKHFLSEECRRKWWPNKQVLFAYNFDIITTFKKPRKIILKETNDFVRSFDFTDIDEMMIKNISNYNPSVATNKQLGDDLKITSAWYNTKKSGGYLKHSLEEIKELADRILKEIKTRVEKGEMKYNFMIKKKQTMSITPFSLTLSAYQFDHIYEAIEYMFRFSETDKFIIEKKLPGQRCMMIKEGNSIHLYDEKKRDISTSHEDLTAEAKIISDKSLALDCQLSNGILYITDCVYYNEDIKDIPLNDRKAVIHSLNFTKHIKENPSIVVSNSDDAKKGLILMRTISHSEGAMIKKYRGKYSAEDDWIELNKKLDPELTTTETEGIAEVSGEEEGKKVESPAEQGEEDSKAKDWDDKSVEKKEEPAAEKEMSSKILTGLKDTSTPIVVVNGESLIIEGHTHRWSKETTYTSISENHKHKMSKDKKLDSFDGHTHNLIDETTTTSPGIPAVQGKKIDKKKKPNKK